MTTTEDYYNGENLGGYQYMKLADVVSDFELQSHDNQSYLYGIPRSLLMRHAKSALKTINKDAAKDYKAMEITVGGDLIMKLPPDYVSYERVSLLVGNLMMPLDINGNVSYGESYLQDNEFNLLFDDEGNVMKANEDGLGSKPFRTYQIDKKGNGGGFQTDTSKYTENGSFSINKRMGVIYFGSSLVGKDIVLEYKSDGVDWANVHGEEITFHKLLEDAVKDLVYFNSIERRNTAPANEKRRARTMYLTSRHKAIMDLADLDVKAIEKVWRKGSKWVKG